MTRLGFVALALASILAGAGHASSTTLRAVMHSDLKILDPIWTTAYITRNHGYMVYDTLFAMDARGEIRPQMVGRYEVSTDKLTHTMTLRPGLLWHDGKPVTAEDCVASIRRWAARDTMGQTMMSFVKDIIVVDEHTFRIQLREPTGLVPAALGKPSSNVPFMMPKRVADTPPDQQISDFTGSGPFVFDKSRWRPGDRGVYVKFAGYRPRREPASGLAGGKVAKVDRVEWKAIEDEQTAVNALLAGEIDYLEAPSHDLLPVLRRGANVELLDANPFGNAFVFRFNTLYPPFDNVAARRAVMYALNQEDFLKASIGDPAYYRVCKSIFPCGSPLETMKGMDGFLESNFDKARAELATARYDGTPVVLLHATDVPFLANLAPVAKSLLEKAGFRIDMQSMDWQTLAARRARKDRPASGGWNALITWGTGADHLNPIVSGLLNASCDKALWGWPCDAEMERLRDRYARETDPARLKAIAEAVQIREVQYHTHVPLGMWWQPIAIRKDVHGVLTAPVPVFWNVAKAG